MRHRGTLGGTLAHGDPASDLPAAVLALGGTLVAQGPRRPKGDRGRRLLPGIPRDRPRARRDAGRGPGAEVAGAPDGRSRSSTAAPRTGRSSGWLRSSTARPASRSSTWDPPRCGRRRSKRQCAGGASAADAAMAADEGTDPPSDINASSEYRRHLAKVLVRRALEEATS